MFPFLSRQVVQLTKEEFVALLSSQRLPISSLGAKTKQAMSKVGECRFVNVNFLSGVLSMANIIQSPLELHLTTSELWFGQEQEGILP